MPQRALVTMGSDDDRIDYGRVREAKAGKIYRAEQVVAATSPSGAGVKQLRRHLPPPRRRPTGEPDTDTIVAER